MSGKKSSTEDYGYLSRIIHKIALDYRFIAETCFDIEESFHSNSSAEAPDNPIYIVGLARSGTTAVLNQLYSTGEFRSFTYKDMPFVLLPSLWQKITQLSHNDNGQRERAHGDGVMVGSENPEAFEEIFWRLFCGSSYIKGDDLIEHSVNKENLIKYRQFVQHLLLSDTQQAPKRYLAKNNNNILRLNSIKEAFPHSLIIIPFRDPLQQAISLLNQHKRFCLNHTSDPFSLQYMNWLGHFEFGAGHKRLHFKDDLITSNQYSNESINYWLGIWLNTHQHILQNSPDNSYLLCYELLCENPDSLNELHKKAQITAPPITEITLSLPVHKHANGVDEKLLGQCMDTYHKLRTLCQDQPS